MMRDPRRLFSPALIRIIFIFLTLLSPLVSGEAKYSSNDERENLEETIVYGKATKKVGIASSSSEGLVALADFNTRPISRIGELAEVLPGMVATQHSGEGKANQYFLRGMNLDHGTDFSMWVEGMPINLRAHAHGQGYLDLNFIIPELVESARYSKGPYKASNGDFSSAGSSSISLYDSIPQPLISVTLGTEQYRRLVAAGSADIASGKTVSAVEILKDDGPWVNSGNVDKLNINSKYSVNLDGMEVTALLLAYSNKWHANDQLPKKLVEDGILSRFGSLDSTLEGESYRYSVLFNGRSENLDFSAFASRYGLRLFSNFTYFLNDPTNGDQFEQLDRRNIFGGNIVWDFLDLEKLSLRYGAELRADIVKNAGLYSTRYRTRTSTIRQDAVDWLSLGSFIEAELDISRTFRAIFGLRGDYTQYEVEAFRKINSGSGEGSILSPKFSLIYSLNERAELYANYGTGFHSNDVRGRTVTIDPITGNKITPVDLFVNQIGYEVGSRFEQDNGSNLSLTIFSLSSDSELIFTGDSGSTEPGDASKRQGIEIDLFKRLSTKWAADMSVSFVKSRFVGVPESLSHIPNAKGRVIGAGITWADETGSLSARIRHFGDAALVEDNTISNPPTTLFNAKYERGFDNYVFALEILNILDSKDYDVAYFFESQTSPSADPTEDIHFHPVLPRTYRLTVTYKP